MTSGAKDLSLGIGAVVAFLLPAAGALKSRMRPLDLTPAEQGGADLAMLVMTIMTCTFLALIIYLVRRYVVLGNEKNERGWDTFVLFFFLGVVGNVLARTVPLPGY